MNIAGVIAEYNPFHNGHAYQLREIRNRLNAKYIIVAMSGDFVQRGTPAILPKHIRAEMALKGGADLVLELPVRVSTSSAEGFAQGGVKLLSSLGVVTHLCFGTEERSAEVLEALAVWLSEEPAAFRVRLKELLKEGNSFPVARMKAVLDTFSFQNSVLDFDYPFPDGISVIPAGRRPGTESVSDPEGNDSDRRAFGEQLIRLLSQPNNLLGLEYIKAIRQQGVSLKPYAIPRSGAPHGAGPIPGEDEQDPAFAIAEGDFFSGRPAASAGMLRKAVYGCVSRRDPFFVPDRYPDVCRFLKESMPPCSSEMLLSMLQTGNWMSEEDLDLPLRLQLLQETPESLKQIQDLPESLAMRVFRHRNECAGFQAFTDLLKTKELTWVRIQRALLHLVLHLQNEDANPVRCARVLGFRKESSGLLRLIKAETSIPVVTRTARSPAFLSDRDTIYASNFYETILSAKASSRKYRDETQKQIVTI